MKIAYIIERFPAPTEHFILNEILELLRQGAELTVFAFRKTNDVSSDSLSHVDVHYIPGYTTLLATGLGHVGKALSHAWPDLTQVPRLLKHSLISAYVVKAAERLKIDHIHAHFGFVATDIAQKVSAITGIPFSCTLHAQDIYRNDRTLLRRKLASAKFIVTCTGENRNYLIRELDIRNEIIVIYHGIDLAAWPCKRSEIMAQKSPIKIVSIGRLVEKKGFVYLLKALRILTRKNIAVECCIVGDGPLKKMLKAYAERNGILHLVTFIGYVSHADIRSHLAYSDVFVLPCVVATDGDRDGIPNVLLEAMATGLPVISTHVSAIHELIEHESNGLLVEPRNPASLATAIVQIAREQLLYQRIRANARKSLAQKFDARESTGELLRVFNRPHVPERAHAVMS